MKYLSRLCSEYFEFDIAKPLCAARVQVTAQHSRRSQGPGSRHHLANINHLSTSASILFAFHTFGNSPTLHGCSWSQNITNDIQLSPGTGPLINGVKDKGSVKAGDTLS